VRPSPPPTVEVWIDSVPSGAKVLRDGQVIGTTPYRKPLPRGERDIKLVLQLRGHRDQSITVRPTTTIKQSVKLVPMQHDRAVNPFDD
jgi:hypothetical protein